MSQITLTAGAHPAFLSKTYVNRDCTVSGSTGDSIKYRLYDMDFSSVWASTGSNDSTTETITVALYEGALSTSRSIDFIALMGVNLKNFLLEYSANGGSTWTTVSGGDYGVGVANLAASNLVLSLGSPITADTLRLSMYKTQTENQEKQVGGFLAALGTFQATNALSAYEPERRELRKEVTMADGSTAFGYVYRSDGSFEFYKCKVGWRFVTTSERTSFRAIKNTVGPVLWYPEPGDQVQEIFLAQVVSGSFKDRYSTTYKGAGYDIEFELMEIGGG